MGLFYVRDRGTVFFLTVAPFKINGFMKTVCFFRKPSSVSVSVTSIIVLRWQRNPKDRLKIDVTTWQNPNQCNLCVCMIMCVLCVCKQRTRGLVARLAFLSSIFFHHDPNACQLAVKLLFLKGFTLYNATNKSAFIIDFVDLLTRQNTTWSTRKVSCSSGVCRHARIYPCTLSDPWPHWNTARCS